MYLWARVVGDHESVEDVLTPVGALVLHADSEPRDNLEFLPTTDFLWSIQRKAIHVKNGFRRIGGRYNFLQLRQNF